MNKRYYETCTRQTLDPNTRMEHYWCASKLDTSLTETYVTGLKGKCSDYLIPQDEGCQDHFHLAGNKCVRISTFLVTFDDAHNACLDEGAELLTIEDGQISKDLQILLQNKRQKYLHYFQTNVFWVGAEYQNGWKWINSRTNQLKPFGPYTNWKTNMPDLGCPPTMGCSNISRIYVDAESGFTWKAAQREELIGYICQSRCTPPYKWSKNLNSCIYVAISNKTIPEAIVDCAKTNATLYAFRNCAELELLRLDMLDAGVPRNANYAIGMFRGLQNSWNSRNPTKAKFQNSLGYSLEGVDFSKDQGLCLARDDYVKLHLRVPVAFGLHLNEAKLSTYNENLNDPNTRLQKHHYVCQMDDNFACPKDYHKYSDTCLKIVHDAELDMMEAKMACREEKGMILAITANSLDVQVITEFIKQNQSHENTSQYWMKAQFEPSSRPTYSSFFDPLIRCNCSESTVDFYKHDDQCYYKEWTPMGFAEANSSCANHSGSLATGLDQSSLQMIFRYEELNKNKSGMWVGVNRQFDKCVAGSADCPYHWTDLFNTPINSSRLRISRNLKHLPCLRIMGQGLLETDCSAQYESLCVRNDPCPPDVYPGRTNCTLLELYGPNHRILKSQCSKKAGFVCQRNQAQSDFSREKAIGKQLVLTLTKEVGLQDQSGKDVVVTGTNIGFSTRWIRSFQMGSALFGGKSYLDLAKGLEGGKGFSIFFTIELWELTHLATIMDFRDPNNETNGLLIELRNGAPVFILRNNQGPQEFQTIDSSRMTEPNKFASYGITYDSVTKRGTIYRDQTYGFQNGSTELSGNYFHLDAEDWFVTALRHPGRLGSSRIDPSSQGLQGGLSCVQIYNTALSPGQVLEMDHCAEKHEKCYPGQIHWDDKCFKMSHRKASFAQAEVKCNAKGETGYKSQLIHSMEPDLLDYLSRILKENTGESSFWVGLDSRAGFGYYESADGISIYNSSGSLWTESSSTFGNCAKVPESNGGRLDTDDCEADYYYFCQQTGRHLVPDDPCPEGFTFYRGSCLLPSRETMTFENAQEYCGIRGATVYAAKTKAQLEFAREYAKMNIKRDIWMGVQIGLKQHFVDEDMYIPLRVMESDDKFYADGMVFDETIDFNFNIVSSSGHWNGPCVFLRASYGYKARNTKCTQEFGFLCEWREPQCPEDYTLAPELGPRSCYKTLSHPGPYGSDSCHDSADNLRKLAWPRSTKALEAFRSRTRITSGSIWLGAELSDNQTWMDGRGGILEVPGALQDLREDGIWYHDPPSNQTAGCLKMDANGLLQTLFGRACQNESHLYACEYKACYTTQGKQCIFPFSYQNVSASGEVTDLEYTKCSTLDVFLPWCATEVDDAKNVLDWGFCVPDCPSEVVEVACLSEPDFPVFVTPWDASDLVNFTTSYDQGSALVTKELDFVSFQCPEGYVFEGSNNITHYAMCHNWEYLYLFDRTARCERVACPCPPKFSKDSVVSGTTDWNTKFWTCLENETFPQDTHITYTCPEGYVFETPQLLAFGQENSELFVKCETYADWNVTRKPKCVPINCTDDPPSVPRNDKGNYTWDSVTKTYLHQITYNCPSLFWGYPSTGENSTTIHCMANKHWNRSAIEDCKKLPCPRAPPKAPEGGWLWFGMDQTKYQCPNGYEFQGGSGPYMVTECAANRKWRPSVTRKCVPRSCHHPPPLHFMNMEMIWPAQNSQLGVQVTYECPYKKLSTNYQSVQTSTCIWSNDDDNMIWFPNEIEECLQTSSSQINNLRLKCHNWPLLPGQWVDLCFESSVGLFPIDLDLA
ncbi:uncharacterized protein LOC131891197 [Tigriopus californicus]|uniref:uncharacterized protein LOC131891197 n=1 Tax=Tigriopus californicus TaxID=6832 RepID=UPI0027DA7385|nr:uncharacterized protein LOC131891197 [Tigriopus californicus]